MTEQQDQTDDPLAAETEAEARAVALSMGESSGDKPAFDPHAHRGEEIDNGHEHDLKPMIITLVMLGGTVGEEEITRELQGVIEHAGERGFIFLSGSAGDINIADAFASLNELREIVSP